MRTSLSKLALRTPEPAISWLMKLSLEQPRLRSLAAGFTDNESLPVRETKAAMTSVLSKLTTAQRALQYGATAGDDFLRKVTVARLAALDQSAIGHSRLASAPYEATRCLITHGSQQLLYLITETLCDEGDIALVEDPTYFVYLGMLQSHGVRARGIRIDAEGIDPIHLEQVLQRLKRERKLSRVKMLYVVSYFQNPSAVTTSYERKREILKILKFYERRAGHPIYLLEDAAYRELRFEGSDIASALSIPGAAERVLYAGTYSKPFATGIRAGFGLLPEPIRTAVLRLKGNHDFGTANLLQQILAAAIRDGGLDAHLKVLRKRYARKAQTMSTALRSHFPSIIQWAPPKGGLYIWATAPHTVDTGVSAKLFKDALKNKVLYVPGELCYADDPTRKVPTHQMRLSFGGAPINVIVDGIKRLGKAMANSSDCQK